MRQHIKYELFRMRTTRSSWIIFVLMYAGAILFALTNDTTGISSAESVRNYLSPIIGTLLILPSILVAQSVTHEFSNNAIRTSLVLFPRRKAYLFIKWLVATGVSLILVYIAARGMASLAYFTNGVTIDSTVLLQQIGRIMLVALATFTLVFAFALIFQQTFLAVAVPVFILGLAEGLLGFGLKIDPTFLPNTALGTFSSLSTGGWIYLATFLGYTTVALGIGIYRFCKEDF